VWRRRGNDGLCGCKPPGPSCNLRDHVARVLPEWSNDDPGYHALLGMYAFGLEECGDYRRAEDFGRWAIDLNPRDAWAHHAVAHVMDMQGRLQDGIAWMTTRQRFWSENNFFAVHNWWHLALFHLELDQVEAVLALYDEAVRAARSRVVQDLVDAAALLWRLLLRGVDVGLLLQQGTQCGRVAVHHRVGHQRLRRGSGGGQQPDEQRDDESPHSSSSLPVLSPCCSLWMPYRSMTLKSRLPVVTDFRS